MNGRRILAVLLGVSSGAAPSWASAAGTGLRGYDAQARWPGSKAWKPFRTDRSVASSGWSPLEKLPDS